jgi:hypothetical protein
MTRRDGTWENPWERFNVGDSPNVASVNGQTLSIDVTRDIQRFLGPDAGKLAPSWILLPTSGGVTTLKAREAGASTAARLVVTPATITDFDAKADPAGYIAPLTFTIGSIPHDVSSLPPLADGSARPVGATRAPNGFVAELVENEFVVLSDDPAILSAVATRQHAVEISKSSFAIAGSPRAHLFRVDLSAVDGVRLPELLLAKVPALRGNQTLSSESSRRLLTVVADETVRGTPISPNWVTRPTAFDAKAMANGSLIDGSPASPGAVALVGGPGSNNDYDWKPLGPSMHNVLGAWARLLASGKLSRRVRAAIVDAGFASDYLDTTGSHPIGNEINPFPCGGGDPCPWHGTHVANTGFGEPGNGRAAAGPGWPVTDLTMLFGFGDMFSIVGNLSALVATGNKIVNYSNAIPIPDWGQALTFGGATITLEIAESITASARAAGTLVFAAAGNDHTDIDKEQCYKIREPISEAVAGVFGGSGIVVTVCPWEETWFFPCENAGVDCVEALNFSDKARASYSN